MRSKLEQRLVFKETIFYEGEVKVFRKVVRLKKKRGFKLDWISENEFNVFPYFSFGNLHGDIGGLIKTEGLKLEGLITQFSKEKTKITLQTNVRMEIYFFMIVCGFCFILNFFVTPSLPFWIFLILPFALVILWGVHRIQEKILFRKVKKYIEAELPKSNS